MRISQLGMASAVFLAACNVSFAQDAPNLLVPNGVEQTFRGYLTGYSYWDNTPPGSSEISHPVLHDVAGGVGTYRDPITLAVGHVISGNDDILDFPAGTRFYLPHLRKYAIVEDTCSDGPNPQNGSCHSGKDGLPWLNIYVDGAQTTQEVAAACFNKITNIQTFIMDPGPNYTVWVGELSESGCQVFPDL